MYVDAKLRETLSRFSMATSIEALRDGLADAALPMGFPYVALVQHGGLSIGVQSGPPIGAQKGPR